MIIEIRTITRIMKQQHQKKFAMYQNVRRIVKRLREETTFPISYYITCPKSNIRFLQTFTIMSSNTIISQKNETSKIQHKSTIFVQQASALISYIPKVFEIILANKLHHLQYFNLWLGNQNVFKKGSITLHNLAVLVTDIQIAFSEKNVLNLFFQISSKNMIMWRSIY